MRIKIVATPPGLADEDIRREWVGITLTLAPYEEVKAHAEKLRTPVPRGFVVRGIDAVKALGEAGKDRAADFWSQTISPCYLEFAPEVCEVVR